MNSALEYKICESCVMDSTDPRIIFHDDGTCSHCRPARMLIAKIQSDAVERSKYWEGVVSQIKAEGKNREYDCIVGVSGGVDSSYIVLLAKSWGLRPLAVHLDNGWNSELAVANIKNLLHKLNVPLVTEVLDWSVFKELQLAMLKASTPDSEAPTDHAIVATLYHYAKKLGIKYSLSGANPYTESIGVASWSDGQGDWKYLSSVYRKFTGKKLKGLVHVNALQMISYGAGVGFKNLKPLFYVPFDKAGAQLEMEKEFGWRSYGGKHYENIYTKFYQGHILPRKFGFDKRKAHFSSSICAGQLSRADAIQMLAQPAIPENELRQDYAFVCKKLGISVDEMEGIINSAPKRYQDYPNNEWLVRLPSRLGKTKLRGIWTKLMRLPLSK